MKNKPKTKAQTWKFPNPPIIAAFAAVGGEREKESPLAKDFDYFFQDNWAGCESFEEAETVFLDKACSLALKKAGLKPEDIDLLLAGDLMNQITPSSFTARNLYIPFIGIYSACATTAAGLALAALGVSGGMLKNVLTGVSSNNRSAERQFRYPNEYGSQRPGTSQITASAAGAAIVQGAGAGKGIKISAVTIGRVVDWGISDPLNMGAAMAPAAAATIAGHFEECGLGIEDYDLVITGDLGQIGHNLVQQLLVEEGIIFPQNRLQDCGMLLFPPGDKNFAGGSGAGCVGSVLYGPLLKRMERGGLNRVLLVATGSLLSPNSCKQHESIPGLAHAVSLEVGE